MSYDCVQGSMCFELMKGVPTGLATLVVGGIGLRIAYHQLKVARAKLKLDRYERRYSVFQKAWEILSETVIRGTRERNWGLATPFNNFLPEAAFLFGPEVSDYLNQCSRNWAELHGLQEEQNDVAGEDRQENIARSSELTNWFFEQASTGCKAMFAKYLNFADPK
jgi:hypothetical protein